MLAALLCNILQPTEEPSTGGGYPTWPTKKKKLVAKLVKHSELQRSHSKVKGDTFMGDSWLASTVLEAVRAISKTASLQPFLKKSIAPFLKAPVDTVDLSNLRRKDVSLGQIIKDPAMIRQILKLNTQADEEDTFIFILSVDQ